VADLTPEGDRAQVLLVAALALGVTFVALALIVNSAIYTENLASRGDTTGGETVIQYRSDLARGVGEVLGHENRDGTSHSGIETAIDTAVSDIDEVLTRNNVLLGATSDATVSGSVEGALINQTDPSRPYTDAGDNDDWVVARNIDRTRAFRFNVSRGLLTSDFTVTVTDGSDDWELTFEDPGSGIEVEVDDGGTTATCGPVAESYVVVDVTGGTVGGEECDALSFGDAPASGYDIVFSHGDDAGGTYSLVVDNGTLATSPPSAFGMQPAVSHALYSVDVSYDFQTADTRVNSTIRVAPGEADG
jgi:hypothetical protein